MPDYYTVALEVSRGRTTRARTETCSTDDAQPCFNGFDIDDEFIRRQLNEPCDRLVCMRSVRLLLTEIYCKSVQVWHALSRDHTVLSAGINHICLCLLSRSWSSFSDPRETKG